MNTMTCIFATNLLNDAAFVNGTTYECYRDESKKVFVRDSLGFDIQVVMTQGVSKTVWGCVVNGAKYHFERNV